MFRKPLSERDIIEYDAPSNFEDGLPEKNEGRLINFQFILRTGEIPQYRHISRSFPEPDLTAHRDEMDQYIDLNSNDELTRGLATMQLNAMLHIMADNELQALLDKPLWDYKDRVVWEKKVSVYVSRAMDEIRGLDTYRIESKGAPDTLKKWIKADGRATFLNEITYDLIHGSETIEHDCETMSILEGIVMQRVENDLLPAQAEDGNLRYAGNYFYTMGKVSFEAKNSEFSSHVWRVSSVSGNAIESTGRKKMTVDQIYKESEDPEFSLSDWVNGVPFLSKNESAYVSYHIPKGMVTSLWWERGKLSEIDQIFGNIKDIQALADDALDSLNLSRGARRMIKAAYRADSPEDESYSYRLKKVIRDGEIFEVLGELKQFADLVESSKENADGTILSAVDVNAAELNNLTAPVNGASTGDKDRTPN